MTKGYYQQPAIYGDNLVFICEEDLWQVSTNGGLARRLTSGRGGFHNAVFSSNGKELALSASEFGVRDVYVMNAEGGELKRLTWYNSASTVRAWTKTEILFSGYHNSGFFFEELAGINPLTGEIRQRNLGPAIRMAESTGGTQVLERNGWRPDSAYWKRYRGGTAGKFFLKKKSQVNFTPFLRKLKGNLTHPMWIGERFYFLSDHEGTANIFSTDGLGKDIKKHTHFKEYYLRNPYTDGRKIVFHMAGDIYIFDPLNDLSHLVEINIFSQRARAQSKLASVTENLESVSLSPRGQKLALTSRGQIFYAEPWQGPVISPSRLFQQKHRDRKGEWLSEDELVFASDEFGDEKLCIVNINTPDERKYLKNIDTGRALQIKASPDASKLAISNHRNELLVIDLKSGKTNLLFQNNFEMIGDFNWSPDSKWLVSVQSLRIGQKQIVVWNIDNKKLLGISGPASDYRSPHFSEKGDIVYFLGAYNFDPRYERSRFSLYFEGHYHPVAVLLNQKVKSPFFIEPTKKPDEKKCVEDQKRAADKENTKIIGEETTKTTKKSIQKSKKSEVKENVGAKEKNEQTVVQTEIDFEGIERRLIEIPCKDGEYGGLVPVKDGLLLLSYDNEPSKKVSFDEPVFKIEKIDFSDKKQKTLIENVTRFTVSGNGEYVLIGKKNSLRLKKTAELTKEDQHETGFNPKAGFIDLARFSVPIYPVNEWQQMFDETWRLQKLFFWEKNLGGVDWDNEKDKYHKLLVRLGVRSELNDLLWELVGELGVSHAYAGGGDNRVPPQLQVGSLGAEFKWNEKQQGFEVTRIYQGVPWSQKESSPLQSGECSLRVGDILRAINKRKMERNQTVDHALIGLAGVEVEIEVLPKRLAKPYLKVVRTLKNDYGLKYHDWVNSRREIVHKLSFGKIGYVHIPDMMGNGYAEFYQQYLQEHDRDALIVDVRFNGGGHVSGLILGKLLQQRIGVDQSRWMGVQPYPTQSPAGPIVALTNEFAGSDGDIFSHSFKLYKLGPLIGNRTWGGVIGIWPRHLLMDGGMTTQPEFAFWFKDVGFSVEGHGAVPDIEIDNLPQDYLSGTDSQLLIGIKEALKALKKKPPFRPNLGKLPIRAKPK
jgi:tricorn protease